MNRIELRLIAERYLREENLMKSIKNLGRKHLSRTEHDLANGFPLSLGMQLYYNKSILR